MRGQMLDNQKNRAVAARFVDPVARGLLKIGLRPNQVTVFGALSSSVIALATISRGQFVIALLFLVPLVAADLLDGTMARLSNSVSVSGAFLDSVMDRVTDFSLLIAFTVWGFQKSDLWASYFGLAALAVSSLIPYIRAKAEAIGIPCNVGVLERGERVLLLGIATIAAAFGFTQAISIILFTISLLGILTVLQRISHVLKSVNK